MHRLLALAVILDGGSRSDAAKIGGVTLQVIRDRVLRFNAEGPDGLITRKAPCKVSILDDSHRKALAAIVEAGPIRASHGVVRWGIVDLAAWLHDEFGLSVTRYTLGRELRGLGYRKLWARPRRHGQEARAVPEFNKTGHLHQAYDLSRARLVSV